MTSLVAQKELRNNEDGKSLCLTQKVDHETYGADNEVRRTNDDMKNTIGCTQSDGTNQLGHKTLSSTISSAAFVTAALDPSHSDLIALSVARSNLCTNGNLPAL